MNLYTLFKTQDPENHTRLDRIRVCPPSPSGIYLKRHISLLLTCNLIVFGLIFFLFEWLIFVIRFMRKIYHYQMTVDVADDRYYRYGG